MALRDEVESCRAELTDLRRRERRFRDFAETAADFFWECDADLRMTYLSDRFPVVTGLAPEDFFRKFSEDVSPRSTGNGDIRGYIERLRKHESFRNYRFSLNDDQGRQVVLDFSGVPVFAEDGAFAGYRGSGTNITDRILAERAAKEAEDRLVDAIESIDEAFVLFDAQGGMVLCNSRFREFLPQIEDLMVPGVTFEELFRASVARGQHPEAAGREEEFIRERLAQFESTAGSSQRLQASGRWLLSSERRTRRGEIVGVRTEITELKRHEEELRQREVEAKQARQRLSDAIESIHEGFVLFDAEGRMVLCNSRYKDFYEPNVGRLVPGIRAEDILRANVEAGCHPEAIGREEDFIRERLDERLDPPSPLEARLPDGRWLLVSDRLTRSGERVGIRTDITELKNREAEAELAKNRLVSAIESIDEAFILFDAEDRMVLCNSRYREMFGHLGDVIRPGVSAGDLVRADMKHGMHAEGVGNEDDYVRERLEARLDPTAHLEHQLPDGRWLLVADHRTKDGWRVGIRADITEMKTREEALRTSQAELRAARERLAEAVESINEGFVLFDAEDRFVLCNSRYLEMFPKIADIAKPGVSAADLIRENIRLGVHEVEPGREEEFVRYNIEGRRSGTPLEIRLSDGRWLMISDHITKRGEYVGVRTDITALKNREDALRSSEETANKAQQRLFDAIESISEGFILRDAEGRFVLCNSRFREMYEGIDDVLVPGTPFETILRTAVERGLHVETGLAGGDDYIQDRLSMRPQDGATIERQLANGRWLLVSDRLTPGGEIAGIRTDITELKRREEALRRTHDELERRVVERTEELLVAKKAADSANRAKSDFLANMSHELRTPLNAIIGFSDSILQRTFGPIGNPKYREYVDNIKESGEHLLELISDILDVSVIESGRIEMVEEVVDLGDLASSSLRLVKARAEHQGVGIRFQVGDHLPWFRGDRRRLKQILANLLTNAVKFTPAGGSVSLTIDADQGGAVRFVVSDTGIGMDEDGIAIALTEFGQVESTMARRNEGTGLGLPLSRQLAEAHQGTLQIDSRPGVGTTVTVAFPAERSVWSDAMFPTGGRKGQ